MGVIDNIIELAVSQIGVTEFPRDSNNVKYNTEFYGREVYDGLWGTTFPWCCTVVWWVFKHADASDLFYGGGKTASCPTLAQYYERKGQLVKYGFRRGDIVFFDWNIGGYGYDHVGIIEKANGDGTYYCIEGNTSLTSNDNGGSVMRRLRSFMSISGAGRPYEDDDMNITDLIKMLKDATPEQRKAVGKELDGCVYDYRVKLPCPDWAEAELNEAKEHGITDGTRPMVYGTRLESAIMCKRAVYDKK